MRYSVVFGGRGAWMLRGPCRVETTHALACCAGSERGKKHSPRCAGWRTTAHLFCLSSFLSLIVLLSFRLSLALHFCLSLSLFFFFSSLYFVVLFSLVRFLFFSVNFLWFRLVRYCIVYEALLIYDFIHIYI